MYDYSGIFKISPYKQIGKRIDEVSNQIYLEKKQRVNVQPLELNSTIRFNSTYLELVDKVYHTRGVGTFLGLWLIVLPLSIFIYLFVDLFIGQTLSEGFNLLNLLLCLLMVFGFGSVIYFTYFFILKYDTFSYTHFPVRFNRKNKSVYLFKSDGQIKLFQWSDLHAAIMSSIENQRRPDKTTYEVRLSALNEQGFIVESFALPYCQESYLDEEKLIYKGLWEYVRRYMEEGVEDSYDQVEKLIPIAHQRETIPQSAKIVWNLFNRISPIMLVKDSKDNIYKVDVDEERKFNVIAPLGKGIFFNLIIMLFLGRLAIAKLAKRPIWPDWVEKECLIDANDPYDLEKRSKNKRPIKSLSFAGLLVYIPTVILAYLNLYATAWFIDMIAMAKDAPINLHKLMEFWNWFG